jgi:hypothetical protein
MSGFLLVSVRETEVLGVLIVVSSVEYYSGSVVASYCIMFFIRKISFSLACSVLSMCWDFAVNR